MKKETSRNYSTTELPMDANLKDFDLNYVSEVYTPEETRILNIFFTNTDLPIYAAKNMPEEVVGALTSRCSRSTKSVRRLFLDEYIKPVMHPKNEKNWSTLTKEQKKESRKIRKELKHYLNTMEETDGGIESVVNVQRSRKFFDTWLAQYGDDSIAETGGVHLFLEGISGIALEEIVNKRVGLSLIVKSSRYVPFVDPNNKGVYKYTVPGEIRGTELEEEYKQVIDSLFSTYESLQDPYLDYIKEIYPKGDDETPNSFNNSRGAKRYDDIRDLLPFAAQTSLGLYANGRAYEDLVTRLVAHPIGELRKIGQLIHQEVSKVAPSFMLRSATARGAEVQLYRQNIIALKDEMQDELGLSDLKLGNKYEPGKWANLISSTPNADVEILTSFLIDATTHTSFSSIRHKVSELTPELRRQYLARILEERDFGKENPPREEVRFRKVPRAFENAEYLLETWGRAGDYRDLHRHRQMTEAHALFTTDLGYDLEKEVLESPFAGQIKDVLEKTDEFYKKLFDHSPQLAQYAVPFGFVQHWYTKLTAREIYWMAELRTGPQGRRHYREIVQQICKLVTEVDPDIFQGMKVDWNDYGLSRRESEKRIEAKIAKLTSASN